MTDDYSEFTPADDYSEFTPVQSPLDVAGGLAKSFGTGLEKGAANTLGTAGDAREWLANLIQDKTGYQLPKIPQLVKSELPWVPGLNTTQDLMQPLQNAGLTHEATSLPEKIAERAGEFAPNAIAPETLLEKAGASIVPAVAGPLAGEAAKGTPLEDVADPLATLLSPFGANKTVQMYLKHVQNQTVPNTQQTKALRDSIYGMADATGTTVNKVGFGTIFANKALSPILKDYPLMGEPGDSLSGPKNLIQSIANGISGDRDISLKQILDWRRRAGGLLQSDKGPDRHIGGILYGNLTDFLRKPPEGALTGPNADTAATLLQAGDAAHMRYKNSQLMDQIFAQAGNRLANYREAGYATGLRQKFRALGDELAKPNSKMAHFVTPEQKDAVENVIHGDFLLNRARSLSKFNPLSTEGWKAMATAGFGSNYMGLDPTTSAILSAVPPIAGTIGKIVHELGIKHAAENAAAMFRTGHPLPPITTHYPALLPLQAGQDLYNNPWKGQQ